MSTIIARSMLTAVSASLLAAGAPAAADAGSVTRSLEVSHTDLDLTSGRGIATLNQRIARAAARVCGRYDPRDLRARQLVHRCRTGAIGAAAPKVELAIARAARGGELAASAVRVEAPVN